MNSLAVRLFFSATVWIILTLLAAGLLLSDLNKKSNFAAFDDRLNLLLETLIGASRVDSSDSITVVSSIGDPRFFQPYSGWYWQVNNGAQTVSRSRSMWDQVFTSDKRLIGGRSQFRDSVTIENTIDTVIESKKLHIVERQISFPGLSNPINFLVYFSLNLFSFLYILPHIWKLLSKKINRVFLIDQSGSEQLL